MSAVQTENTNESLEKARARVSEVTEELFHLYVERLRCMRQIANAKKGHDGIDDFPVFLPLREQQLRTRFRAKAVEEGIDSDMADMFLSMLMSAAKFQQLSILGRETIFDTHRPSEDVLRENLLELTSFVADDYTRYGQGMPGWQHVMVREIELLGNVVSMFVNGGTAVDLGCADGGRVAPLLSRTFGKVTGYDISPRMVAAAAKKFPACTFMVHDLDTCVPLPDGSVNMIVSNSGTASEILGGNPFREVSRLLTRGGLAFLSFYNRNAITNEWWTPWPNTFTVTINPYNDTILVPVVRDDGLVRVYWINARSVTADELHAWATEAGLTVQLLESSSPLWDDKPSEFFRHKQAVRRVLEDERLNAEKTPYLGQYLRIIVGK